MARVQVPLYRDTLVPILKLGAKRLRDESSPQARIATHLSCSSLNLFNRVQTILLYARRPGALAPGLRAFSFFSLLCGLVPLVVVLTKKLFQA